MKIRSLSFADPEEVGWTLDILKLKDRINLFVGASGSGKTRVLNIIFNIGNFAARDMFVGAQWTLHFEHSGIEYTWKYDGVAADEADERKSHVRSEELWIGAPDRVETSLFVRTATEFRCGVKEVPKLAKTSTAIYLLREEEAIKPVHEAFSRIMRRRFWSEDLDTAISLHAIPRPLVRRLDRQADKLHLIRNPSGLNVLLYLVNRYFNSDFTLICDQFKRVFPFVDDIRIRTAAEALNMPLGTDIPVVLIKERGINKPIALSDVSSGMQKVLLIVTDVITTPTTMLYMIDEYENSLGVNAIDFLPPFLAECGGTRQFIMTTHHPLLINAIPVADWFIFHRKGLNIRVTPGEMVEARYGRSKQQRFTQLINDPLYTEGVE